ncbi:MAG: hypothetical protein KatS3mg101_1089 [Patescibacteria group bacterium]|nr:MAG: hypothetical protein KatS3mg101_1089 [Patescibacteria group bacterium]
MKKEEKKLEKKIEIEVLAERIKLLWVFLAELIPYKETLKDVAEKTSERSSMALSMAPILGAFGQDYEEVHLQKEIERKRAKALYELINVLDETEKERKDFAEKKVKMSEGLAQIHKALGL